MDYVYWCSETAWMWGIVATSWLLVPAFDSPFPGNWEAADQIVVSAALLLGAIVISYGMYK